MIARIIIAAALAGLVAGMAAAAIQQVRVTPLIHAAEKYEQAEAADATQQHDAAAWEPAGGLERTLYTVAADLIAGVGFALLLAAVSLLSGLPLTVSNGAVWGLAGFAAFTLAPSAGLPPELPGMPVADLAARQLWWWLTVAATGLGILTAVRVGRPWAWAAGAVLIVLPHLIGAPQPATHETAVPATLANSFAANAIAAQAVFWVVLGVALGYLMARLAHIAAGGLTFMQKIPATIVTGFLGAGKTTLIRHLLQHANGRRIALIINEFGDVGVDGEILKGCGDEACHADDIVELSNGCICCTVADDFIPTMTKLIEREAAPDHIVIETSGLALPQPLVKAFGWPDIRARVTVDGVVTVIDTPALAEGRFAHDEAAVAAQRAADPGIDHDSPLEELFEDQLHCADLVLLNKTDLVGADEVERLVEGLNGDIRPGTHVVRTRNGIIDPAVLLGLGPRPRTTARRASRITSWKAPGNTTTTISRPLPCIWARRPRARRSCRASSG